MNNIMGQGLLKSSLCKVEFKVRLQFHVKVKDAQLVRQADCRVKSLRRALKVVQIESMYSKRLPTIGTGECYYLPNGGMPQIYQKVISVYYHPEIG